jgi:hypothetical protein
MKASPDALASCLSVSSLLLVRSVGRILMELNLDVVPRKAV